MALIIAHRAYTPQLEPSMFLEPQTPESVARAKEVQRAEFTQVIATLLAGHFEVNLRTCSAAVRAHYWQAATTSIQMAEKVAGL